MQVIVLHCPTFVAIELLNALKKCTCLKIIVVKISIQPSLEEVHKIFDSIRPFLPGLIFSINEAGYDINGWLHEKIQQTGSYQINWYVDYPFFEYEIKNRKLCLNQHRIDFVSEYSYVNPMKEWGFQAYFLPLATDLLYFNTTRPFVIERDIAFVGNSSLELMDTIIDPAIAEIIEQNGILFNTIKSLYYADFHLNVRNHILYNYPSIKHANTVSKARIVFAFEWMIGYLYRKDFVRFISETYTSNFTIFGDPCWRQFIHDSPVSEHACYYDNLCGYYRSTKINLNINRIQIHTSFTQRHFDCKASGAFLLTDKREMVSHFFKTSGPDAECIEYESMDHCRSLIHYYLTHEEERCRIAENGIDKVVKYHTYDSRIAYMFDLCSKIWGL